ILTKNEISLRGRPEKCLEAWVPFCGRGACSAAVCWRDTLRLTKRYDSRLTRDGSGAGPSPPSSRKLDFRGLGMVSRGEGLCVAPARAWHPRKKSNQRRNLPPD